MSHFYDSRAPLFFMHVPKVAGTSMRYALRDCLKPQRLVEAFDTVLSGDEDLAASVGKPDVLRPSDPFPEADLIAAHMSASTAIFRYPDAQRVTFLRVPEVRLLSHWLYWRSVDDVHLIYPEDKIKIGCARLGLVDFLSDQRLSFELDNIVTRMLVWPNSRISQGKRLEDPEGDLLAIALDRLSKFSYTDVIEHPNWQQDFATWLGQPFILRRLNETSNIPAALQGSLAEEMTSEVMLLLSRLTRFDRVLWRFVADQRLTSETREDVRASALMKSVAGHTEIFGGRSNTAD